MSIFKDYKKYLDFSCDKAGKVYVDLCNDSANFYHFIPLNEYADCDITSIGLVYSYNNRSTNDIFGKGVRLSLFKRLEHVTSTLITLYNSDFSEDIYYYNSNNGRFENAESDTYIVYDNNKYRLFDKYGNYFEYNYNNLSYPTLYYNKEDNKSTTITEYNLNKLAYIRGVNSTTISFTYTSNLVTNICVTRIFDEFDQGDDISPQTVLNINITYSNSIISEVEYVYYKDSSITHTISMGFNAGGTKYTVSDDISTRKIEVSVTSSKVSGIKAGYSSALSYERIIYINYNTYNTRVYSSDSDTSGNRKIDNYYYFDDENKLMYSYSKEGLAKYRKYNSGGKLVYKSNIEYTNIDANSTNVHTENLIQNSYFNNGTTNYIVSSSSSVSVVTNSDFPAHLGTYMLSINAGSGFYIYQDINKVGISGDIFTFDFWYSYGNYYSYSTTLPTVYVTFLNDSTTVDESIINLKTILRNRSPIFQSEEIRAQHSFNKIRIKMSFGGSLIMYINGLCLI